MKGKFITFFKNHRAFCITVLVIFVLALFLVINFAPYEQFGGMYFGGPDMLRYNGSLYIAEREAGGGRFDGYTVELDPEAHISGFEGYDGPSYFLELGQVSIPIKKKKTVYFELAEVTGVSKEECEEVAAMMNALALGNDGTYQCAAATTAGGGEVNIDVYEAAGGKVLFTISRTSTPKIYLRADEIKNGLLCDESTYGEFCNWIQVRFDGIRGKGIKWRWYP